MASALGLFSTIGFRGIFYGFTSLLFIYPAITSFKNYKKTGSKDYFLFSIIFTVGVVIFGYAAILYNFYGLAFPQIKLITWGRYPYISIGIYDLFYWTWLFCLSLHGIRLSWIKIPFLYWVFMGFLYVFLMCDELLFIFDVAGFREYRIEPHSYAIYIRNPIATLLELSTAIILLYSYFTVNIEVQTTRVHFAKILWIIAGGVRFLLCCLYLVILVSNIRVVQYGTSPIIPNKYITSQVYFAIRQSLQALFALLIFTIAAFFPESLLISEAQILRAGKLYAFVEAAQKQDLPKTELSNIEEYMNEIYKLIDEGKFPSDPTLLENQ